MSKIKLKVVDQNISLIDSPKIYSGDINTDQVVFEFDEHWTGYTKTAVFYRDIEKPYAQILTDNECNIPREVMTTEGRFYFGVFGVKGDELYTSEIVSYCIGAGIITTGTAPEPSPDIWQQILNELGNIRKLAEEMSQGQEDFKEQMEQTFQEYYEELKVISANFMTVEDVDQICEGNYDPIYDDYNVESITQDELNKILV